MPRDQTKYEVCLVLNIATLHVHEYAVWSDVTRNSMCKNANMTLQSLMIPTIFARAEPHRQKIKCGVLPHLKDLV